MRVILQNKSTHLYFQDGNKWTPDPSLAKDFVNVKIASHFVQGFRQVPLDVVMDLGDYTYNMRLLSTVRKSVSP
jgi:hypothetical protein